MRTFNNLTSEEKVVLTTEEVQYYARIDCANRGVIIPQKPITNLKEVTPPTQKYYQVGYESFVFEAEEQAQAYINIKSIAWQTASVGNSYGSSSYVTKKVDDYKEIKSTILYTKEEATDLKSILEYNSTTSKEWKEYNESLSKYNEIESSILEEIREISYKNSRVDYYNKIYSDYLELAGNVDSIAFTFFDKAYGNISLNDIDREIVDEMLDRPQFVEAEIV